jgi:repressor LexA
MEPLTPRQREVLAFLEERRREGAPPPSVREVARRFGFRSPGSAMDHVRALRRKGFLPPSRRRARALLPLSPLAPLRRPVADIPLFGSIPAGPPDERRQEARGCVSVDVETLGFRPGARTFALQVRGDSMVGRHIVDGDLVILEHGVPPRAGDVVAALIDNESTLKTFLTEKGKPFLRAENPRYPRLIPASELVIQGVMVGLIRKRR